MSERAKQGEQVRREVLGDFYVDRARSNSTEFSEPLQEFLNENVWGLIWTRGILERKTRSLVNLAILTATGKTKEVEVHTLGALRNGCSPEEIREVFLQAAVYAGVPNALEAFKVAAPVVEKFLEEKAAD